MTHFLMNIHELMLHNQATDLADSSLASAEQKILSKAECACHNRSEQKRTVRLDEIVTDYLIASFGKLDYFRQFKDCSFWWCGVHEVNTSWKCWLSNLWWPTQTTQKCISRPTQTTHKCISRPTQTTHKCISRPTQTTHKCIWLSGWKVPQHTLAYPGPCQRYS